MNPNKPPVFTEHRRQRLILWALTMLGWLAAALFGDRDVSWRHFSQRHRYVCLERLTRTTIALIVARALQFAGLRTRRRAAYWRSGRDMRRRHWMRSLLGSKLRRALRHKDLATQIAQLIAVLRNLDAYARRLAHRMRHGLMRLWRTTPAPAPSDAILEAPAPSPALADSS